MSIGTVIRTEGIESNPYLTPAQRLVALKQHERMLNAVRNGNVEVKETERSS